MDNEKIGELRLLDYRVTISDVWYIIYLIFNIMYVLVISVD